jgi:hypothetical protein
MIELQPEIEWYMRPYLLEFLIESHLSLKLSMETLYLAINIIDRYSSKRVIYKRHYQLVGCSSLWIASKYHDKKHKVPTLQELKLLCCDAYENHMFIQMESHILNTLQWSIDHPTFDTYIDLKLDEELQAYEYSENGMKQIRNLSLYICESSLFHKSLLKYSSSVIAACSVRLSLIVILGGNCCSFKLLNFTNTFHSCLELLANSCSFPITCLQRKYSKSHYSNVYQLIEKFLNNNNNNTTTTTTNDNNTNDINSINNINHDINDFNDKRCSTYSIMSDDFQASYPSPPQDYCTTNTPIYNNNNSNNIINGYITPPFTPAL